MGDGEANLGALEDGNGERVEQSFELLVEFSGEREPMSEQYQEPTTSRPLHAGGRVVARQFESGKA